MKYLFFIASLLFLLFYGAALLTLDDDSQEGVTTLYWSTDPNPARQLQIDTFEAMHPHVRIKIDPGAMNDSTKLLMQCATGVGPDLIDIYMLEQMITFADAGILLDLTPYAEPMGFGPDSTYPAIQPRLFYEGKQYRYPCNVWVNCIIYNLRLFDEAGVPYPEPDWTWDDFVAIASQFTNRRDSTGRRIVALANWAPHQVVMDLMAAYGARFFDEQGLYSLLDAPEAIQALQHYADLMHVHGVLPTPAEVVSMATQGGWGGALNWFATGRAAMISIGRWFTIMLPNFPELHGNLATVQLPRLPGRQSTAICGARGPGINQKSPHRDEALLFLKYLTTEEYGRIIVEGGDALPPNPALARSGADLVMATVPDPDFHQSYVDAIETARAMTFSSFIDPTLVGVWFMEAIQRVESKVEDAETVFTKTAAEINERINLNLARRPDLQRKFKALTGRDYTPDWRREPGVPPAPSPAVME